MSKYKISICTIAKNQGCYLLEWLEFHKLVGIEHFYFYDNESSDDTKEILDFYTSMGEATYHFWHSDPKQSKYKQRKNIPHPHGRAIYHCLENYRNESDWIAFIDVDEFLFSPQKNNLQNVLEEYRDFPAILVNWLNFGSSGHLVKPKGLQIENYTKRAPVEEDQNKYVKVVCQPSKVKNRCTPHRCNPIKGFEVTEDKKPKKNSGNKSKKHSSKKLRIHHYITRSREEHLNKPRWKSEKGVLERFIELDRTCNQIEDLTIQRFASQLKKNIQKVNLKISSSKIQNFKKELSYFKD